VHLSKYGIERYQPGPSTTPTVPATAWKASFDDGATWHDATDVGGAPTWLVAGPLASPPGSAIVLPDVAWLVPALRFDSSPEVIIRDATFDDDQRPPAIHLDD
jgi:hypothetical protein